MILRVLTQISVVEITTFHALQCIRNIANKNSAFYFDSYHFYHIDVNRRDLERSQSWLNSKQDEKTGCFKIVGFVVHSVLAKTSDVSLTASLLITMLESGNVELANLEVIDSAFRCLENNLFDNTTNYAKSLAAYAFSLKDTFTEKSTEILDELIQQANR